MRIPFTIAALAAMSLPLNAAAQEPSVPTSDKYFKVGQDTLAARRNIRPNKRRAKNVILFVADGMDPTTVAAARIFEGQSRGEEGEENYLSFERFPYIAMSKTYTTNGQTPDSAGTMSAMVTGVKTKSGVLSVTDAAEYSDCASGKAALATTLGELAEKAGLATGVVSTARLTHATPAAVYAHSPSRNWEADSDLSTAAREAGCEDIASQLLSFPYGDGLEVALGGGRPRFLPREASDPVETDKTGRRKDGRDLTKEWTAKSDGHQYVYNNEGFDAVTVNADTKLLGLFDRSHMDYDADRSDEPSGQPSLAEMTEKAIEIVSQDRDGFFLMVEAGRVDHAHHAGNAARALQDTVAFSEAIKTARAMTDPRKTLIIVTADHGHTLTFAGYPSKGNDILGLVDSFRSGEEEPYNASDKKPYTTLGYANGPGSPFHNHEDVAENGRPALSPEHVVQLDYLQQATVPLGSETHGGQDVTIYADGPRAYLFGGVVEQNYIYHVIDDALGLRRRAKD